jgi:hypothetical protein
LVRSLVRRVTFLKCAFLRLLLLAGFFLFFFHRASDFRDLRDGFQELREWELEKVLDAELEPELESELESELEWELDLEAEEEEDESVRTGRTGEVEAHGLKAVWGVPV